MSGLAARIGLLVIAFAFCACCQTPTITVEGVDPGKVIASVKEALQATQDQLESGGMPRMESVALTLTVYSKVTQGAEVSVWVVSGGTATAREATQTMTFTLIPPPPSDDEFEAASMQQALVNALLATAKANVKVEDAAAKGEPILKVSSVSTTVKFSITGSDTAGIGFEVLGAEVGGEISATETASHAITIKFADPKQKKS